MPEAPGPAPSAFVEAFGGVRGLVDSALPATVFVLARLATGSLTAALYAAVGVGVVVLGYRLLRGQPLQQAVSGFLGLAVAVVVARATGTGEGFFLPGILTTALTGVAFVVSLVLRKPAVGLALQAYDPAYEGWRDHPPLLRAVDLATAFWALTFFVRAGVAYAVYRQSGDNDGALLIVINTVKWPLIVAAALLTVALVKRAGPPPARAAAEPLPDALPAEPPLP
ncbi:MAG: hypothetical protein JWM64_643 [Frankiales bacterium]|nr:hypothetical protein [Frankiales bacterium]